MGPTARILVDRISIDTGAWLAARTAGRCDRLTADLHAWLRLPPPGCDGPDLARPGRPDPGRRRTAVPPPIDPGRRHSRSAGSVGAAPTRPVPPEALAAWCARRYATEAVCRVPRPQAIVHTCTRLDARVVLVRTLTTHGPVVVVRIDDARPQVLHDRTVGPWAWYDADTVEIACPVGHRWTWRTGRELLDATGRPTTLARVFGPDLSAPFSRCPVCAALARSRQRTPCGCDGSSWIVCPTCDRRCTVRLPPSPPGLRPRRTTVASPAARPSPDGPPSA